MTDPVCPDTGAPMFRDIRPMTICYKGEVVTFDMPGWYCTASNEGIHGGEDMKVTDREFARLKAKVEGLLPPAAVRRIRKRLGLTIWEASEIIGGGRNAFQKYESGETLPSQAVGNLLRTLERRPEEVLTLRREREQLHRRSPPANAAR